MHAKSPEEPEIGDLVKVKVVDTKAVWWIQDAFSRGFAMLVVPPPSDFNSTWLEAGKGRLHVSEYIDTPSPANYHWVLLNGKTNLIAKRYLKVVSKCIKYDKNELR